MNELLERAGPWAVLLVQHNWPVIMYVVVAVVVAWRAYLAPRRHTLLFLYGTVLLIVAYEYQKHALPTVVHTTDYLFSEEVNPGARSLSQSLLVDLGPSLLRVVGCVLILGAAALRERAYRRSAHRARSAALDA